MIMKQRINRLSTLSMAAVAAVMSFGLPVQAQEQENPTAEEECVVPPDDNQTNGERDEDSPSENRTERLADCGGVLKPPATDDQEFVEPAPDEGKTPVIPPQTLPDTPENGEEGDSQ